VVLITCGDDPEASRIARTLVEERHAACVSRVGGIRSIYRWQGAVEEATEVLLLAKTRAECVPALIARVRELHSYDVFEAVALPIAGGYPPYLDWIADGTRTPDETP
jgi:periplasmic divalent cation tolerance protein